MKCADCGKDIQGKEHIEIRWKKGGRILRYCVPCGQGILKGLPV